MISENTALIIYEDDHLIVCHKPAGIPTQTSRIGARDMVSILKNHLAQNPVSGNSTRAKRQHKEPYIAVIHRLDQPVEGLLVFAKTPAAARELNQQLTSSGFGKYYLAAAEGVPEPQEGLLEDYMIKDSRTNTSRVCSKDTPGAKLARLHYSVAEIRGERSVLHIHLDTGRHHQIRVQMAHNGHPLIGDRKYGGPDFERLMLCACRLEFRHPVTGEMMKFELSDDLKQRCLSLLQK